MNGNKKTEARKMDGEDALWMCVAGLAAVALGGPFGALAVVGYVSAAETMGYDVVD